MCPAKQHQWRLGTGAARAQGPLHHTQQASASAVNDIMNCQFPAAMSLQGTPPTSGSQKATISGILPGGNASHETTIATLDTAPWTGIGGYPSLQLLHTGSDGTTIAVPGVSLQGTGDGLIAGTKRPADREGDDQECPLPFLRDISTAS